MIYVTSETLENINGRKDKSMFIQDSGSEIKLSPDAKEWLDWHKMGVTHSNDCLRLFFKT